MATFLQETGEQIRKARKNRVLSQEQLAEAAKMDPKSIVQIEAGKRNPTLKTLRRIASALQTSVQTLVTN